MSGEDDPQARAKQETVLLLRRLNMPIEERRDAINRLDAIMVKIGAGEETTWLRHQCDLVAKRVCRSARNEWNVSPDDLKDDDIASQVYLAFRASCTNATRKKHFKFCEDPDPTKRFRDYLWSIASNCLAEWFEKNIGSSPPYVLGVAANTIEAAIDVLNDGLRQLQYEQKRPDWLPHRDGFPTDIRDLARVFERFVSESAVPSGPDDVQMLPSHLRAIVRAAVEEAKVRRRAGVTTP